MMRAALTLADQLAIVRWQLAQVRQQIRDVRRNLRNTETTAETRAKSAARDGRAHTHTCAHSAHVNRANATDQSNIEAARTAQTTQDKLAMQNDIEDVRRLMGSKWGADSFGACSAKPASFARPSMSTP